MNKDFIRQSIASRATLDFSRSSGPGGQNVNKVNTRVRAAIHLSEVAGLSERERAMVLSRLRDGAPQETPHNGIDSTEAADSNENEDCLISVNVQDFRTQALNRGRAYERLFDKIIGAAYIPKKRRPTRPTRASKERRLLNKAVRAEVKRNRHKPQGAD